MISLHRQHHWLAALIAGRFFIAAVSPRFDAFGHRHHSGRVPHLHLSHASPRHAHDPQDHRRHQPATQALPFGGVYALPTAPHEHSSSESDDTTVLPRQVIGAQTDLHWHFDDGALPPGMSVAVVLEPLGHGLSLTHAPPLSIRSQTRFDIRPRGPPF